MLSLLALNVDSAECTERYTELCSIAGLPCLANGALAHQSVRYLCLHLYCDANNTNQGLLGDFD